MTLIKLAYARFSTSKLTTMFTRVRGYALGCYLRYGWFPRRTLLGDSLNKSVLCSLCAYIKACGLHRTEPASCLTAKLAQSAAIGAVEGIDAVCGVVVPPPRESRAFVVGSSVSSLMRSILSQ